MENIFNSKKDLLKFFVIIFLIIISNLIILQIPLLCVFGYEFSVINSIIIYFLVGINTILLLKKNCENRFIIFSNLFLISIPLIFGIISNLFIANCALIDGFINFGLFTLITGFFSYSLSLLIHNLIPKYKLILFVLLSLIILFFSLYQYYISPQLYLFNPIFGYFIGFVFDENYDLSLNIILYRILILIISFLMIFICSKKEKHPLLEIILIVITAFIIIISYFFADDFGFSSSSLKLDNYFKNTIEDGEFTIYTNVENDIFYSNYLLEISKIDKSEIEDYLNIDFNEKIKIYVFDTNEEKKELLGTAVADFTKPWLNVICISKDNFIKTIKHELAHIIIGEISENIFKVAGRLNIGLIEGAAMATDFEFIEREPHTIVKNILKYVGDVNILNTFEGLNFAFNNSSYSYVLSGSFSKFLIDKYGVEKFKGYYKTADCNFVYGKSLSELNDEFERFIKKLTIDSSDNDSLFTMLFFKRKSFIFKPCLRYVAKQTRICERYIEKKDYYLSQQKLSELWKDHKTPKVAELYTYSLFRQKKFNEIIEFYKNDLKKKLEISFFRALVNIYQAYMYIEEIDEATKILKLLISANLSENFVQYIELLRDINQNHESKRIFFNDIEPNLKFEKLKNILNNNKRFNIYYFDYYNNEEKENIVEELISGKTIFDENVFYYLISNGNFELVTKYINNLRVNTSKVIENNFKNKLLKIVEKIEK